MFPTIINCTRTLVSETRPKVTYSCPIFGNESISYFALQCGQKPQWNQSWCLVATGLVDHTHFGSGSSDKTAIRLSLCHHQLKLAAIRSSITVIATVDFDSQFVDGCCLFYVRNLSVEHLKTNQTNLKKSK